MIITKNKNIYVGKQPLYKNTNNSSQSKTELIKDSVCFAGYWSRVNARKPDGFWASLGWSLGGESAAMEIVEEEMREEINSLTEKVAVKRVHLSGLKTTLQELKKNHSTVTAAKKSELRALEETASNHNQTIQNLQQVNSISDQTIQEIQDNNHKLEQVLATQTQVIENDKIKNRNLSESITQNRQQNEQKLHSELEEHCRILDDAHNAELDNLAKTIEGSIKIPDPIKMASTLHKADGFGKIAGYDQEKDILIKYFGVPVTLEKSGKPAEVPNGILFFGPKGCGKSTFATSLAKQFECNIIEIPATLNPKIDIKNLREAAKQAKNLFENQGKRTILLIDDFEEFAPIGSRITGALKGFMDSVSKDYHCTVVATTKSPEKIDDILLRDGRFHKICIPPPNKENTIAVLQRYATENRHNAINYDELSEQILKYSPNGIFSNSQLKTIMFLQNQDILLQNAKKLGSDISKDMIDIFEKQIELVKHI